MCLLLTHPLVSIVISDYSGVTVSSPSEIPAEVDKRCIDFISGGFEVSPPGGGRESLWVDFGFIFASGFDCFHSRPFRQAP